MSEWKKMTDEEWRQFLDNPWMNRNAIDDLRYTLAAAAERAERDFETAMAMKNAEIGELRQRAERLQRERDEYLAEREDYASQYAIANAACAELRQRAARAEAECERLRGIIYGVAFNLDHDAPRDIIVRCRESLTAALSPAPAANKENA